MSRFGVIAKMLNKTTVVDIIRQVFQQDEVQEAMININKQQLSTGKDMNDRIISTLGSIAPDVYSRTTIFDKKLKGRDPGIADLFDTGEFYDSFTTVARKEFVQVVANFKKKDGDIRDNFDEEYQFLGIPVSAMDIFIKMIVYPRFIQIFRNNVLR